MKKENQFKIMAVLGRPVFHSRSPDFYNLAFKLKNINACYVRLAALRLEEALATIKELNIAGFNLTSPYKEKIISYLDELDRRSAAIAAVNTVIRHGNKLQGFNTDPEGFRLAALAAGINLDSARILVLGAGGTARAVLFTLKENGVKEAWVTNRSEEKAKKLASQFGYSFLSSSAIQKKINEFTLIVSCLPRTEYLLSYHKIPEGCRLIEASYLPSKQKMAASRQSGLIWLLGQAVEAFRLFTGRKLSQREIKTLRSHLFQFGPKKNNLALIGFMGCGKTSLARLLAEKRSWDYLDSDELIEKQTGRKIQAIFARGGEAEFREIEQRLLYEILMKVDRTIVALGGGAVKSEKIRKALSLRFYTVWLWTPLKECLKRSSRSLTDRPLLNIYTSQVSRQNLLKQRIPLYACSSDLLVPNPEGCLEETARLIDEEINSSIED